MRISDWSSDVCSSDLLPSFIAKGKTRWQAIRQAYRQAAAALDASGQPDDRALARDVRRFLDKQPDVHATPEIFAARHTQALSAARAKHDPPVPVPPPHDRGS